MEEMTNQMTRTVELASQVKMVAKESVQFRTQCLEIKTKTTELSQLLLQTKLTNLNNYKRPARLIIDNTEQALENALTLVDKCRTHSLLRLIFTPSFSKITSQLDDSFHDFTWLLCVFGHQDDDIGYIRLPPIAANEPILCLIWEQIGSLEEPSRSEEAAASLFSLIRDNYQYGKLVIEEGGVGPQLKLAEEGNGKAVRAIGLLGRDKESVEKIVRAGVCSVFAKVLREGSLRAKMAIAMAVHGHFSEHHAFRMIVALEIEQGECLKVTMEEQEEWVIVGGEESLVQGTESDSQSYSDRAELPRLGSFKHYVL